MVILLSFRLITVSRPLTDVSYQEKCLLHDCSRPERIKRLPGFGPVIFQANICPGRYTTYYSTPLDGNLASPPLGRCINGCHRDRLTRREYLTVVKHAGDISAK